MSTEMLELFDRLLPMLSSAGTGAFWLLILLVLKGYILGLLWASVFVFLGSRLISWLSTFSSCISLVTDFRDELGISNSFYTPELLSNQIIAVRKRVMAMIRRDKERQ